MSTNQTKLCNEDFGLSEEGVNHLLKQAYRIDAKVTPLDSYSDQNFRVETKDGKQYVFKVANANESRISLEAQNMAMKHTASRLDSIDIPGVCMTPDGRAIVALKDPNGVIRYIRLLTFVPGKFYSRVKQPSPRLEKDLGRFLGKMTRALDGCRHPGLHRYLSWDLRNTLDMEPYVNDIKDFSVRRLVNYFLRQFETHALPMLPRLRYGTIHGDLNYDNLLVNDDSNRITGVIDFGDVVESCRVFDPVIAIAYALHGQPDPMASACRILKSYHLEFPLTEPEVKVLIYLIAARQCATILMAAHHLRDEPDNDYLNVSVKPAVKILERFIQIDPAEAHRSFRKACGMPPLKSFGGRSKKDIMELRVKHFGKNLGVSYRKPLKIVRGAMQYLYDESGRTFLDTVNNVCHVGHCHPRVVKAAQRQFAELNTNTRYLHDHLVEYARRLTETLPDPLQICFFVCSGSEANELAIRLARTHTGNRDFIVHQHSYHGNTNAVIDISAYKFDGPGGKGAPPYVHNTPVPDPYRGRYKTDDPDAGKKYAQDVKRVVDELREKNTKPAAFIHESVMSVAGQIFFPADYLPEAYRFTREAGGVCIADEVQVGFGRVGSHMWGFETQGVVPDIVTMGKPIGNGHPMAAVVTTAEIAESFNNGMEYFNTFGGNPVSCAVGLAVLDVIRDENLQAHARDVGDYWKNGLLQLKDKHPIIGDVRGAGLFLGIELVTDRETLEPAAEQASYISNRMKEEGILISIDGPLHNVIKIKPPMVITKTDVDRYIDTLDRVLSEKYR